MTFVPHSLASTLKQLRARSLSAVEYAGEITKLADLDPQSDALERAERIFTLRRRIAALKRRIRELEGRM